MHWRRVVTASWRQTSTAYPVSGSSVSESAAATESSTWPWSLPVCVATPPASGAVHHATPGENEGAWPSPGDTNAVRMSAAPNAGIASPPSSQHCKG